MRREFSSRDEMVAYLREQFPTAVARDPHVSATRGGRKAAMTVLGQIKPGRVYQETRNSLNGAVTRLSMYIRHGILSLVEVRDTALRKVKYPREAEKFVTELAWRDYWQRVYEAIGDGVWDDREAYKTGFTPQQYADSLPEDVLTAQTGLACMDGLITELYHTGYLHNHARMWLAAYLVDWRRVRWQVGARWFLIHLLDGDPASNNLSWQWVASTFSAKPYYFNRENLEKFTDSAYCKTCPLREKCPLDATYESLERRLFPNATFEKPDEFKRGGGRR